VDFITSNLTYLLYGVLAVVFVWVSIVYRDRPSAGASASLVADDSDDDYDVRRNHVSAIRSHRRLTSR